jgi:flavin reductase (DIM6/NTAB) family NADH-FMN oxidoreductase RutF
MDELDPNVAFSLTSPLPYVLVTSIDAVGRPNVMGVSWITKASFSPFLMVVSIGHGRYSHGLIKDCGEFVICYPSAEQEKGAMYCGTHSGRGRDKFASCGLVPVPSRKVRPPTIEGCTVALECRVVDSHEAGDHSLFVGEVVAATGDRDKPAHLFATTGARMISMDQKGDAGPG